MADGKVIIDSSIDDDGISRGLKRIKDKLGSLDDDLIKTAALGSAISLSPSLVPALAAATGGALALGSAFTAAGVGIAGFAAVAVANLNDVFEASENVAKAEEKLAQASTSKERKKALEELKQATEGLSDAQLEALKSLQSFKEYWEGFSASFEGSVFDAFNSSLAATKKILELSKPAIQGAADGINNLLISLNKSLGTSDVKEFFEYIGNTAQEHVETFGKTAGNTMLGFMNLMTAFSPLAEEMNGGILKLSESFAQWTSSIAETEGFQEFLNYVSENGQTFLDVIGNLAMILVNLGIALAPLVEAALNILDNFTGLFNALLEGNPAIQSFIDGLVAAIPQLIENGMQLVISLLQGIVQALPQIIAGAILIINSISGILLANLPMILEAGVQILLALINGVIQILPQLITTAILLIHSIASTLIQNLPEIILAGFKLLTALVDGIIQNLPTLLALAMDLIYQVSDMLIESLPQIVQAGSELLDSFIEGIIMILPELWNTIQSKIADETRERLGDIDLYDIGQNIIDGLISGISSMGGLVMDAVSSLASLIPDGLKDFLGIHSPARLIKNDVGRWIPLGQVEGMEEEFPAVEDATRRMAELAIPDLAGIRPGMRFGMSAPQIMPAVAGGSDNAGGSAYSDPWVIQIPLDGEVIAEVTVDPISRTIFDNMSGNRRRVR